MIYVCGWALASLNNLAVLYRSQGRYGDAEPLLQRALQLCREVLGEKHPSTLDTLSNLAALYRSQGRFGEAEPLYTDALKLSREVLGETHVELSSDWTTWRVCTRAKAEMPRRCRFPSEQWSYSARFWARPIPIR